MLELLKKPRTLQGKCNAEFKRFYNYFKDQSCIHDHESKNINQSQKDCNSILNKKITGDEILKMINTAKMIRPHR